MLKKGIYEQVINKEIKEQLENSTDVVSQTEVIDNAMSSEILSKYISDIIKKGLENISNPYILKLLSLNTIIQLAVFRQASNCHHLQNTQSAILHVLG